MEQKLIFTNLVGTAIDDLVSSMGNPHTVVISDVNTSNFVMPYLKNDSKVVANSTEIVMKAGDSNKSLDELTIIWKKLISAGATRSSVIINIGGGVVSDIGGFAASTFKRGMKFINVPTTLLGAVDASVGGKTGINFNGFKNQLGTFSEPEAAIISTCYLNTLPQQELLSGYAEMLKHGLLENDEIFGKLLSYSLVYPLFDSERLLPMLEDSVMVKQKVVLSDPTEKGFRKVLNFGHTIGHAFESFAMAHQSPIAHGYAVAWGLIGELVLSHMLLDFPSEKLHKFAQYVKTNYGAFAISCDDYPSLIEAMRQDKKNESVDKINFTLLHNVGEPEINQTATPEQIGAALDIYRDLMGLA